MADVGRPPKYNKEELAEIRQDFQDYIDRSADPTVVGFTAYYKKYHVNKWFMYERPEFSDLVKEAVDKQEAYIVAGAITNKLNPTFAIFRLKQPQHGWTDRSQVDTTGEVKHTYEELNDEQLEAALKARENRVPEAS